MGKKHESIAEIPVDGAYEGLNALEKALFGMLVGAAGAMETDTLGIDIDMTLKYLRDVAPEATALDLMVALDTLQKTEVTAPYEDGTITTCMVSVLAYISDKSGVRTAINVAVPFRNLEQVV